MYRDERETIKFMCFAVRIYRFSILYSQLLLKEDDINQPIPLLP